MWFTKCEIASKNVSFWHEYILIKLFYKLLHFMLATSFNVNSTYKKFRETLINVENIVFIFKIF